MKNIFISVFILLWISFGCCCHNNTEKIIVINQSDVQKVGNSIPVSEISEPVGEVRLYSPRWIEATEINPAYAVVEGSIMPVDPEGWPINFRILLPEKWSKRSMQQGGGGMNGTITVNEGNSPILKKGFAIYGSDSGHQTSGRGFRRTVNTETLATGPTDGDEWALNDEAIQNLAYMQMKKTHDAAMVIIKRVYDAKPEYNYFVGNSQGGREALTVAQRYPKDYDGIISNVPIVNFSTLMLAPILIRIQEIPKENRVSTEKIELITKEFLRQTDNLDGLSDGIISNYTVAREIFNVNDGKVTGNPWALLRSSVNQGKGVNCVSDSAKLTDGEIKTLEFSFSSYHFTNPLANGVKSFGMWTPIIYLNKATMLVTNNRFKGQEGAGENARMYNSMGMLGVTGFLMQDLSANPLDYVEGGKWEKRRWQLSEWLDSTDPDLSEFYNHGGKIIFTIGAMDYIASSGAQMDYYQSLIDVMEQDKLDKFARLYVVPNGDHSLRGKSCSENGNGEQIEVKSLAAPNHNQNIEMLIDWVEKDRAPAKTLVIDESGNIGTDSNVKGYLLCSYPDYQRYIGGSEDMASSYDNTSPF
ncbi:MAG: tannase/feruloyl esterase family alpha/beta hydrolase [Labilibaculum sp.]|nr:tannase/feruloyl esterase family alpha/beta hydrolase [Labilibaculum sp.]